MSSFEFVFSLFGLLLGLSLAEVLGGFGKALKATRRPLWSTAGGSGSEQGSDGPPRAIRIGRLTPLLGLLVMLDLAASWSTAWSLREALPVNYLTLMLLLVVIGLYYLAANLVFPEEPDRCPDFDAHYWANKRLVLGAVLALNMPGYAADWLLGSGIYVENPFILLIQILFIALLLAAIVARGPRLNLWLLAALVSLYPIGGIAGALRG